VRARRFRRYGEGLAAIACAALLVVGWLYIRADHHNVIKIESDDVMEKTVRFVRESMSNRLNDDDSAIVICGQRVKDTDVFGDILAREADYCHLMIPMRFEPLIYPLSADGTRIADPETDEEFTGNELGWIDPRALDDDGELLSPQEMGQYEGMLAWPERFDQKFDRNISFEIGDYGYASQYQQSPVPRKRRHHQARILAGLPPHQGGQIPRHGVRLRVGRFLLHREGGE
jgi:hypothetical protein